MIGFSSSPYGFPACMCVTGVTDTPTYGNGVQEKKGLKKGLKKTIFGRDGLWGGGSTERPFPDGSESRPLDHRYLRKGLI